MNQERLDQIEKRIEELNIYKKNKGFTDKRLDYQIDSEIERLNLEKEDILYGTHNIEIMNLKFDLEYYNNLQYNAGYYNKVLVDTRVEQLKEQIEELVVENNAIKKSLVRRKHNV